MKIKRWQKWFFILVVVLLLAACAAPSPSPNEPAQSQTKTIAVVTPYMANETTKYVIDRFKSEAEAKGWRVIVTDTAGDFNLLVSRIQDAVAQNVDAIVLGMGDPAQMTQGLEVASKANIPVFGIDAGNAPGVLVNVTSDNASLGKLSAETLLKSIGEKGNIIMFTHDPHPGVRARAAAAAEVFSAYPQITVIEKKHIEVPGPLDNARKITEDLLTAYPQTGSIAGIWAGWDEPALGAVQALLAAGRSEIKVVGIDGTDFAKAEIKKQGPFIASVAQDFDAMAAKVAEIIEAYFNGTKPQSESILIPGRLLTVDNIE
jgi:ribose transport system substrate-binding protein